MWTETLTGVVDSGVYKEDNRIGTNMADAEELDKPARLSFWDESGDPLRADAKKVMVN